MLNIIVDLVFVLFDGRLPFGFNVFLQVPGCT